MPIRGETHLEPGHTISTSRTSPCVSPCILSIEAKSCSGGKLQRHQQTANYYTRMRMREAGRHLCGDKKCKQNSICLLLSPTHSIWLKR